MNLTISQHARAQAAKKKLALALVWEVAHNPQATYGSFRKDDHGNRVPYRCDRCNTDQQKWTGTASDGTKLCLAVNACCGEVVTIWLDQVETELRDDQRAKGVKGYKGRDGQYRPDGKGDTTGPKKGNGKPLTAKQKRAAKKARHEARRAREEQERKERGQ
jgi:hypothetical protein